MMVSFFTVANVGVPFVAGKVVAGIGLIIPIILIEAGFIAHYLKQRYLKALSVAAIANIISTLVGIVLEVVLVGATPDVFSLLVFAVEIFGGFLLTVFLEFFIVRKAFKTFQASIIWKAVLAGNIVTYILLIIGSMGFFLSINTMNTLGMKRNRTMADMRTIGTALGSYQVDNNLFPVLAEGTLKDIAFKTSLSDGMTTSYYEGVSKDAWGGDFYYSGNRDGYTLKSFGKDRKPDGKGELNSDIVYINGTFVAPSKVAEK